MQSAGSRRILLVEDHEDTAFVAARLLRLQGYEVVVAGTIKTALSAAHEQHIDLALCDIGLPDGDGCVLMRELREKYGLPGVAVTGFAMAEDVTRLKDAGFVKSLVKPIDFAELCRAVEEALGESS